MAIYGYIWLYMAIYGYILHMALWLYHGDITVCYYDLFIYTVYIYAYVYTHMTYTYYINT